MGTGAEFAVVVGRWLLNERSAVLAAGAVGAS